MNKLPESERSLLRYLAMFYLIWLSYFTAIILLLGEPGFVEEHISDLAWQLPVASLAMMGFQYRFALKTPAEMRGNFWSYRFSNLMFCLLLAVTVIAVLTVI